MSRFFSTQVISTYIPPNLAVFKSATVHFLPTSLGTISPAKSQTFVGQISAHPCSIKGAWRFTYSFSNLLALKLHGFMSGLTRISEDLASLLDLFLPKQHLSICLT